MRDHAAIQRVVIVGGCFDPDTLVFGGSYSICLTQLIILTQQETSFMTQSSRNTLYRRMAMTVIAIAAMASALPAQAQHNRHGGGHGRPSFHGGNRGGHGGYRGGRGYRRGGGGGGGNGLLIGTLLGVAAGAAVVGASQRPPPPPPGAAYYPDNYPPGY
jgi:hypothetical protein